MPLGVKPECAKCGVLETLLWHATDVGSLCNNCLEDERNTSDSSKKNDEDDKNILSKPARKSTRITRYCKPQPTSKTSIPTVKIVQPNKGKGRRHIFKKQQPIKASSAVATPVTSNFVFYKGSYFQIGDIVSLRDIDGGIYYAQIRGLLTDQYCEKSAAITWLLPTTDSPPPEEEFSPETYVIGPEEDLPRKLECMAFVMHAPSDYYKLKNTPYPPALTESSTAGFIWTSLRNELSHCKK